MTWIALGMDCAWLIFLSIRFTRRQHRNNADWRIKTFLFGTPPWYRSWLNWWLLLAATSTIVLAPVRLIYLILLIGCGAVIVLTGIGWWRQQFHVLNVLTTWLICLALGWGALMIVFQQ